MVFYIIYMSRAVKVMPADELAELLKQSRKWNSDHHITGLLLYIESRLLSHNGGRFIQVLEGEENDVRATYNKIKMDQRHCNVLQLNEGTYAKRTFPAWDMGFKVIDKETYESIPGFFNLDDSFLDRKQIQRIDVPMTFLRSFYTLNTGT
jgi:hypothetical protein